MNNRTDDNFLLPRFWLLWLLFACIYPVTRLPFSMQHRIGRLVGICLYHLGRKRRHIAAVNLSLCFPELDEVQRKLLLKQHYRFHGMGLIETFMAWWSRPSLFQNRVSYEGLEHLTEALKKGKGVLLLSGHFTTLEISGPLVSMKMQPVQFDMIYRAHKNPLFDHIMAKGRERWNGKVIDRRDIRGILRSLKSNHMVWYGPDQDYGSKHSVFVPFMGVMAATVTGTARLAKLSNAPVIPYLARRTGNGGYHVKVFPALENFPCGDPEQDAIRINQWFDQQIHQEPADYIWTHRRFKTPPPGGSRPY